ncbi:MAG: ATP-dependent zinc metalloprotease FtsH, partial [Elusimicrobia bacterium]|nr:ATP-dependent zinc metalloprotease FtsH [Elusimicrobiota bacterium]
ALGARIPKGVLLVGSPGTGKTLLARAVAGEANVPFFSSSGSEFVEMFVGVGAARVRDLFEQGKKNAPCLLFIDELDAVGRHRFAGIGGGHDEREQTLNQILVEMDGFESREGVILIAATNRPDVLDPALLRPGRFDRHIMVPPPDLKGREEILRVHATNVRLAPDVDWKVIARRTPGFVGADLANVVNEAALLAARNDRPHVEMKDLENAIDRVMAGPERKSRLISEHEKKIVAFHECGHTLVAKLTPGTDPVHKVSIISRGHALGYTMQLPTEDRYLTSRTELFNKILVLLGGRVAEMLIFNEITTGAQDDLMKATNIANKMVTEFGMSDDIGPIAYKKPEGEVFMGRDLAHDRGFSEHTAQEIDREVKKILTGALEKVKALLQTNRDKLERLANALTEKEMLNADEVNALLGLPASS